jgi:hypothetical protein
VQYLLNRHADEFLAADGFMNTEPVVINTALITAAGQFFKVLAGVSFNHTAARAASQAFCFPCPFLFAVPIYIFLLIRIHGNSCKFKDGMVNSSKLQQIDIL